MKKKEPCTKEHREPQAVTNYITLPAKNIVFISPRELASRLNVNERTIRRQCARGEIKGAIKAGKLWKIPVMEA